jgi:outer membrane protein OmpA-like peptidoglycan-associated protein
MNGFNKKHPGLIWGITLLVLLTGCTQSATTRATRRDKTLKGAGIGALSGAALSVAMGNRKADQILTGTAIGAGIGAGVGAYMDAQEEKLARIPGTTVERVSKDTLLVHFDSDILFATDSATLAWAPRMNLEKVAGVIKEYKKTAVVIQGHTDSTGTEAHNQDLSERRAGSVKSFFVTHGVNQARLAATGFGEGAPVASNATNDGRRQNRRVNILLKTKAV